MVANLEVLPSPYCALVAGAEVVVRLLQEHAVHHDLLHDLEVVSLGGPQ